MPSLLLHIFTIPTNRATTAVLLRNALSAATGNISLEIAPEYFLGCPSRCLAIQVMTPVCIRPASTMNSTPTTTVEEELNPLKASFSSTTPLTSRIPMAAKNTTSALSFVKISTENMASTVTIVIHA